MAQQTYNQILDMWRKLGNNHLQVKTFTVGDIFEVDANTVVFPQVHLITEQASMTPHQITYNFKLIAMDLVEPDESNEDDVLSDTMQYIQPDVATICTGMAASMGAVLLCAGAKGKRSALPHSRVMIHQPLGGAQGQASDIEITAREIQKLKKELYDIISSHSGQDFEKVSADSDRDYWMIADEAKTY